MEEDQITIIKRLVKFIKDKKTENNKLTKAEISNLVKQEFNLSEQRSVFVHEKFIIRFLSLKDKSSESNTVLGLKVSIKYNDRPIILCLVKQSCVEFKLGNITFIKKVSHSSIGLTKEKIKGSSNLPDYITTYYIDGIIIENNENELDKLFEHHKLTDKDTNLDRIIRETLNIQAQSKSKELNKEENECLIDSPNRAYNFCGSEDYNILQTELNSLVKKNEISILIASCIENSKIRSQIIEYLIAGNDQTIKEQLIKYLSKEIEEFPELKSKNELGDYYKTFNNYITATDIKTKIMFLDSNPKGFNIDKMIEFLSKEKTVFLYYFIGINDKKELFLWLASMYDYDIIKNTRIEYSWGGRDSRGHTQLIGEELKKILNSRKSGCHITTAKAVEHIRLLQQQK